MKPMSILGSPRYWFARLEGQAMLLNSRQNVAVNPPDDRANIVLFPIAARFPDLRREPWPAASVPASIGLPSRARATALPKWRLKRAFDYIETHLAESVTLAELAASTGLTSMHFAAQFRAATGVRPHEYLLSRRIARARELLATSKDTLVDIALGVGFQTQPHFTTVFKRFVGATPSRWRQENRDIT
jgi:AraC-like DNA-binding protein